LRHRPKACAHPAPRGGGGVRGARSDREGIPVTPQTTASSSSSSSSTAAAGCPPAECSGRYLWVSTGAPRGRIRPVLRRPRYRPRLPFRRRRDGRGRQYGRPPHPEPAPSPTFVPPFLEIPGPGLIRNGSTQESQPLLLQQCLPDLLQFCKVFVARDVDEPCVSFA